MDDFTFPTLHAGGECKQLAAAFPHHQLLGLGGSPPPWILAVAGGEEAEEDKMDMLWEDFNEELACAPPLCPLSPLIIGSKGEPMLKEAWLDDVIGVAVDPEKRGKRLAVAAHDSRVVRRRRWSLLLMLRLLKKLFLVKKSGNPRTAPV